MKTVWTTLWTYLLYWTIFSTISGLAYWLFKIFGKKQPVKSRHGWYTASGCLSRVASFFALRWADSPNDLFPIAVFAYGMLELFGLGRSIKVVRRLNARVKKIQQKTSQRPNVNSSGSAFRTRPGA